MTIGAAERRLFVCPMTGRHVRTLYFVKGRFCSRHAYRIPYSTQVDCKLDRLLNRGDEITLQLVGAGGRGPARGRRRARLIAELKRLEKLWLLDDEQDDLIHRHDLQHGLARAIRDEINRRRRGQSGREATIAPGYTAAGYISPWKIAAMVDCVSKAPLDPPGCDLVDGRARPWPGLALPRAALEDHLVVDLRVVQRSRLIRSGETTYWAMAQAPSEGGGMLYLAANLRDRDHPHLLARFIGEADGERLDTRQAIGLISPLPGGRNRWLFLDPGGGRACEVLALRCGLLASRQAQHLVNRSQIRSRRS